MSSALAMLLGGLGGCLVVNGLFLLVAWWRIGRNG